MGSGDISKDKLKELEEARHLTPDKVKEANKNFGLEGPPNLVVKIDKKNGDFHEWAKTFKSGANTALQPFDHLLPSKSGNVEECRKEKKSGCSVDPSCTAPRSNTTLFTSGWLEWYEHAKKWNISDIKDELGLWYDVEDACVIVLEILDRDNIRVPCGKIPSVDCEKKCDYGGDLPDDMCSEEFKEKYPELHGIIEGQSLCTNEEWSMPFKGNGETPNDMREYIIHMGPKTIVRVKLEMPLKYCLDMIQSGKLTDPTNFAAFEIKEGGGKIIKLKKNRKRRKHKTKKRRSKKRRSKKRRSKKRRSRKY
jgi:hypothetical protein